LGNGGKAEKREIEKSETLIPDIETLNRSDFLTADYGQENWEIGKVGIGKLKLLTADFADLADDRKFLNFPILYPSRFSVSAFSATSCKRFECI